MQEQLKAESTKLIKYFLASLTIPEKDLWVNLSPYEKDRIIPQSFGLTEMGRDLLAEDYMLKQITASLIYPEDEIGKKFWKRIYKEAAKRYGSTDIPVNTFNKVWIIPEKAVVYENAKAGTAYVVESKLKVMLEQDYLSLEKHQGIQSYHRKDVINGVSTNQLGSQIVREIVIPELTTEVNENKNFSHVRQVYNSLILAIWYKKKIKDSILSQVYADKKKVSGVEYDKSVIPKDHVSQENQNDIELIYQRYLRAFKKGVFNYIKEEGILIPGRPSQEQGIVPRKYFSGGINYAMLGSLTNRIIQFWHEWPSFMGTGRALVRESVDVTDVSQKPNSGHMSRREFNKRAAVVLGALLAESMVGSTPISAQERDQKQEQKHQKRTVAIIGQAHNFPHNVHEIADKWAEPDFKVKERVDSILNFYKPIIESLQEDVANIKTNVKEMSAGSVGKPDISIGVEYSVEELIEIQETFHEEFLRLQSNMKRNQIPEDKINKVILYFFGPVFYLIETEREFKQKVKLVALDDYEEKKKALEAANSLNGMLQDMTRSMPVPEGEGINRQGLTPDEQNEIRSFIEEALEGSSRKADGETKITTQELRDAYPKFANLFRSLSDKKRQRDVEEICAYILDFNETMYARNKKMIEEALKVSGHLIIIIGELHAGPLYEGIAPGVKQEGGSTTVRHKRNAREIMDQMKRHMQDPDKGRLMQGIHPQIAFVTPPNILAGKPAGDVAMKGGIDLAQAQYVLHAKNDGQEIKFHVNSAMIKKLQNALGFTIGKLSMEDLKNLRVFLDNP
ncbi:MAG: hypothetical protein HQL13_02485 [Candidatus Omnitrophica bacterium]|nr:hypothetical protein [Candidatus Omnitrophota bacterium]